MSRILKLLKYISIGVGGLLTLVMAKDLGIGTCKVLKFKWEMYNSPPTVEGVVAAEYTRQESENSLGEGAGDNK